MKRTVVICILSVLFSVFNSGQMLNAQEGGYPKSQTLEQAKDLAEEVQDKIEQATKDLQEARKQKNIQAALDAQNSIIQALQNKIQVMQDIQRLGLSKRAIQEVERARLEEIKARNQETLARAEAAKLTDELFELLNQ